VNGERKDQWNYKDHISVFRLTTTSSKVMAYTDGSEGMGLAFLFVSTTRWSVMSVDAAEDDQRREM
jgi:hypothetical protein